MTSPFYQHHPDVGTSPRSKNYDHGCDAPCEWYVPPKKSIPVDFCMNTSLHGLHHIVEPSRHMCERVFWLVAFTAAVVASVLLFLEMWSGYQNMPIITVFNPLELTLEQIPFPGITICSVNNIKKSTVEKLTQNMLKAAETDPNFTSVESLQAFAAIRDVRDICDTAQTFTQKFFHKRESKLEHLKALFNRTIHLPNVRQNYKPYRNPTKLLMEGSQSCSDLLMLCMWLDEIRNCSDIFAETETDFGHCCTFNTVPTTLLLKYINDTRDREEIVNRWAEANITYENLILADGVSKRKVPRRQKHPGRSSGLSIILDPELHEYFCPNTDSNGFVISVSSSLDFPRIRDTGIAIRPDTEVFVSIRPEITLSDASIKKFSKEKRHCYWDGELELDHYSKYTTSNCMDECIAHKTMEDCKCVRYYMPRTPEDPTCRPSQYNCTDKVRRNLIQSGLDDSCDKCLPTCTEISYFAEATALTINKDQANELIKHYPNYKSAKEFSIVHLFFEVDSAYPRMRKELYTIIDLISNTGGLLGLCMGFSCLSLLEILYYCTMRIVCKYYRKKKYESTQVGKENSDSDDDAVIPVHHKNPNLIGHGWNVNNGSTMNKYPSIIKSEDHVFRVVRNSQPDTLPGYYANYNQDNLKPPYVPTITEGVGNNGPSKNPYGTGNGFEPKKSYYDHFYGPHSWKNN